jgi:NAD(P)-dependent dehydrogenase (short-subunit alcohol dehydrogenase family)
MTGSLDGRVVLVTGGASGIGAATTLRLLEEGATVAATDVDVARGQALLDRIGGTHPGKLAFYPHDVASEAAWIETITAVETRQGNLDAVVNNAGVLPAVVPLVDTSLEEWRRVMAVNLDGVFLGVKHAMRAMTGRGGSIINLSSVAGLVGMPLNGAYGASKAGVLLLTKCAALEGARLEPAIRVNAVHPGYIETEMVASISDLLESATFDRRIKKTVPLRKLGSPIDIAEAVVFLASDRSRFMTGASLVIDGGMTAQ